MIFSVRLVVTLPTLTVNMWKTLCGTVKDVGGSPPAVKGRGSRGSIKISHRRSPVILKCESVLIKKDPMKIIMIENIDLFVQ